jgi:hypothetical protein
MAELENALRGYCEAAAGTAASVPAIANRWARQLCAYYMILRKTQAGKDAIASLMSHEDRHVRLWAAAHSLEWAPDSARAALERMRDSGGAGAFDAKWTLIEYQEKGRLSFGTPAGATDDDRGNKEGTKGEGD